MNQPVWTVRDAAPSDATALINLTRRVYGDSYYMPSALNPKHLADDITSHRLQLLVGEIGNTIIAQGGLVDRGHGVREATRLMLDRRWLFQKRLTCRGLIDEITFRIAYEKPLECKTALLLSSIVGLQEEVQLLSLRAALIPLGITFSTYPTWQIQGGPEIHKAVPVIWFGRWDADNARPRQLHLYGAWLKVAKLALDGLKLKTVCFKPQFNPCIPEKSGWQLEHCTLLDRITCSPFPNGMPLSEALTKAKQRSPVSILVNIPAEANWAASICQYLEPQNFIPGAYLPMGGPNGEDILQAQLRPSIPSPAMQMRLVPQAWAFLEVMVSNPECFAVQTKRSWRQRKVRADLNRSKHDLAKFSKE